MANQSDTWICREDASKLFRVGRAARLLGFGDLRNGVRYADALITSVPRLLALGFGMYES